MSARVLVIGGTAEARRLAARLDGGGAHVVTVLAGRVRTPGPRAGELHVGPLGGVPGLARLLAARDVAAVVDAAHPFAARISAHAADACARAGVPLLRLERPGWTERPGDRWTRVPDLEAAAAITGERHPARVLLTVGSGGVAAFAHLDAPWFAIRAIEPPGPRRPPRHELLLARGPFTAAAELTLLRERAIDLLVTKDSGGPHTAGKLAAARELGVAVIVVDRPRKPPAPATADVEAAAAWALARV